MKLIFQPAAEEDILHQFEYYLFGQGSEQTAERFYASVDETCRRIARWPGTGAPVSPGLSGLKGMRSASVRGFPAIRVYYIEAERIVYIIRVLHGKRDLESILQDESLGPS